MTHGTACKGRSLYDIKCWELMIWPSHYNIWRNEKKNYLPKSQVGRSALHLNVHPILLALKSATYE